MKNFFLKQDVPQTLSLPLVFKVTDLFIFRQTRCLAILSAGYFRATFTILF